MLLVLGIRQPRQAPFQAGDAQPEQASGAVDCAHVPFQRDLRDVRRKGR